MLENNNQNINQQIYNLKNNIEELQDINRKLVKLLNDTIILNDDPVDNIEITKVENNYQKIKEIINTNISLNM